MSGYLLKFKQTYSVKIGGRRYPVVKIGNQLWMAENLDYAWAGLDVGGSGTSSDPNAWYYNNDESTYGWNGYKCGLLYNWYAASHLETNKSTLLPDGWHVPSASEVSELANSVGGISTAGMKLKALDESAGTDWPSGWNGTDDYEFSMLPGGVCGYYGSSRMFSFAGTYGYIWTSDAAGGSNALFYLFTTSDPMQSNTNDKLYGYSLRLVKSLE